MITFFLDVPGCGRGYLGPGNLIPSRTGVIVCVWFLTSQCVALKVALATTANISTARAELRATSTRRSSPRTTSTTSPRASVRLVFCQAIARAVWARQSSHVVAMFTSALYLTGSYDPEGTLGNLTSIFMVFLGLQSGRTLMAWKDHKHRVVRWYIWSIVLGTHLSLRLPSVNRFLQFTCSGFIALGLCEAKQNGGFFPLNKNLYPLPPLRVPNRLQSQFFGFFRFSGGPHRSFWPPPRWPSSCWPPSIY